MSDRYTLQIMQLERAKGELRAFVASLFEDLDDNHRHTRHEEATKMVEEFITELEDNFG